MSITLQVQLGTDKKVVKYEKTTLVSEVLANCIKKFRIAGAEDGALLLAASPIRPTGKWLNNERTLQEEGIQNNDILEFRKKHVQLKVKLTDGTTKTLLVDTTIPTIEVCKFIGDKILIKNGEEFGLQIEKTNDATHKSEVTWLDPNRTLGDQGISEESHLIYKKKFFVDDGFISSDDPASIHVLYMEAHKAIVEGAYPCSLQEAILFAAFQCQFELRNYNPEQHHEGTLKLEKMLPPAYIKQKNVEQSIFKEHKKLSGMTEVNAKFRYVQLCRSLKTYGMSVFKIQMPKQSSSKKMVDKYLGITKQGLFLLDGKTKAIEKEYPLDHLRRWSHTESTLTLDFGTYEDDYLNCNTTEGETINNLISGYIDLIMKKLQSSAAQAAETSGTADLNADLENRPGGKRGTVNTSAFERTDDDSALFTTARRLGRPNIGGGHPHMAQELSAAVLNINRMIEEAEKLMAEGFDSGNQTDEIPEDLRAQFAATIQAVNATMSKLLEPLSRSFVNGTPLSPEEISEAHRLYAPQIVALVESILALAKNPALPPKARAVMLAAAKSIASTLSNFLLATQEAAANPDDSVARENVFEYAQQIAPSLTLMETLSHGTDFGSEYAEIMELVKQTTGSATALQAAIAKAIENFESPVIRAQVQLLAAQLAGYDSHMRELIQTLAPYLNDPVVKKSVHDTLKIYSANLSHLAKCVTFESETGEGPEAINAAIASLKGALNGLCVRAVGSEIEPKAEVAPTQEPVDDEKMVQDELEAATRAIRELTEALRQTQQQPKKHTVDPTELANQELSEGIIDATKNIAMASEKLMQVAVALQKELVIAGRAAKAANQYKRDPAWAQGLISASQTVTFVIRQLVESAQACAKGNYDEERLRVLATNVNASAIRLVTAAKVKAPPNSQYVGQLGEAHRDVASATNTLVERAKRPSAPSVYSDKYAEMTPTNRAIKEIEVQTKILKLQKALEDAQVELGNLRKEEYSGAVNPATVPAKKEPATRQASTSNASNAGMWPALKKTAAPAAAFADNQATGNDQSIGVNHVPVSPRDAPAPTPTPTPTEPLVEHHEPEHHEQHVSHEHHEHQEAVPDADTLAEKLQNLDATDVPSSTTPPPTPATPAPTPVPVPEEQSSEQD